MDVFENIKIHFWEIIEKYKGCITDARHLFLIIYSKNLIKTCVLD